jgi:hypothetical protein
MYKVATKYYEIEEKKRRYQEMTDPTIANKMGEHIDNVLREETLDQEDFVLPAPPRTRSEQMSMQLGEHGSDNRLSSTLPVARAKKTANVTFQDNPVKAPAGSVDAITKALEKMSLSVALVKEDNAASFKELQAYIQRIEQ